MSRREKSRCSWADSDDAMRHYHDEEWGVPVHDDRRLFEMLTLEGAQAGLSWSTILRKRPGYQAAFERFDIARIARFDAGRIRRLLRSSDIVRNRLKVRSVVTNARAALELERGCGSLDRYLWAFVGGAPIQHVRGRDGMVPLARAAAAKMSEELRRFGFTFVGPTICYAFMQAVGMVNDHITACFRWKQLGGGVRGAREPRLGLRPSGRERGARRS